MTSIKVHKTVPASRLAVVLAALSIALVLGPEMARADYTTTINPLTTWGNWQGWGCSLAWWANAFGSQQYDPQELSAIVFSTSSTQFDGRNLPGLGLNIARYNLGGSSSGTLANGQTMVAPNMVPVKEIQGFETTPNVWNWSADANQRAMLQYAKADGADYFEMFSNSPMWWMTNNYNPSGAAGGGANLNLSYANSFASYIATTAQYFSKNYGITFNAVEPFNEPSSGWWNSNTDNQEGSYINASTQATIIGLLRTQLNSVGLNSTAIAASDENNTPLAVNTWNSFSSTTKSQIGLVQTHGYSFNSTSATQLYNAVQGKQLWNSEYGDSDASGMTMAEQIDQNFTYLHNTAWCYWQPFDGGGWGLINDSLSTTSVGGSIGSINTKYYVLAQYTRSIREGMTILSSGDPNTVAAYDPVNHDLVLVTLDSGAAETVTYNLASFNLSGAGAVTDWTTAFNGSKLYQQSSGPSVSNGELSISFAASSVQTLEIQNVFLNSVTGATWAVSGGSGAWATAANWSSNTVPGAYTAASFAGGGGTCVVNAAGSSAASLNFSGSAAFALTGSGGAGLTVQSGVSVSNSSAVTIAVPLALSAASTWSIAPGAKLSVSSAVSGSYSLTETGGGMLVLESTNPGLTGPVTVSGGTLYAANTQNSGNEVLGNAQRITINSGGAIVVDGPLGAGYNALVGGGHSHPNIYVNQGGLLASTVASPASNHLGQLVLDGGTVSAAASNTLYGTWNLDGGVTTPGDIGATSYILGGNLLLTEHTIVNGSDATVFSVAPSDTLVVKSTITSSVADTSSPDNLVVTGGGTLILSGSSNYSTGTYVESGRLIVASATGLPTDASLIVGADAASDFAPVQAASVDSVAAPTEAVPEPSALAWLITAALVVAIVRIMPIPLRTRVSFQKTSTTLDDKAPPFGRDVADSFVRSLEERGLRPAQMGELDYAFTVDCKVGARTFYVMIAVVEEGVRQWLICADSTVSWVGRLFGINDRPEHGRLVSAIDGILKSDTGVSSIRWYTPDTWNKSPDNDWAESPTE